MGNSSSSSKNVPSIQVQPNNPQMQEEKPAVVDKSAGPIFSPLDALKKKRYVYLNSEDCKQGDTLKSPRGSIVSRLSKKMKVELTEKNACSLFNRFYETENWAERTKQKKGKDSKGKGISKEGKQAKTCLAFMEAHIKNFMESETGRGELMTLQKGPLIWLLKSNKLLIGHEYHLLLLIGAWCHCRIDVEALLHKPKKKIHTSKSQLSVPSKANSGLRGSEGLYAALSAGASQMIDVTGITDNEALSEMEAASSSSDSELLTKFLAEGKDKEMGAKVVQSLWEMEEEEDDDVSETELEEPVNIRGTSLLYKQLGKGSAKKLKTISEPEEPQGDVVGNVFSMFKLKVASLTKGKDKVEDEEEESDSEDEQNKLLDPLLHFPSYLSKYEPEKPGKDFKIYNKIDVAVVLQEDAYLDQLQKKMKPFLKHIRWALFSPEILHWLESMGVVPQKYLMEGFRYHYYNKLDIDFPKNILPRKYKARGLTLTTLNFDPKRAHPNVQLSNNNLTVCAKPATGCAHKSVMCEQSVVSCCRFTVTLNQYADCYSCVGIVTGSFDYKSNAMIGIAPNTWGFGLYPGTHVSQSDRRIQASKRLGSGDVVTVDINLPAGSISFSVNGNHEGTIQGINAGVVIPAMTVCEMNSGGYTLSVA